MHVALAQLNPLVGDLQGNADRILSAVREAEAQAADLVLTPELSLWGYPPGTCCCSRHGSHSSRGFFNS